LDINSYFLFFWYNPLSKKGFKLLQIDRRIFTHFDFLLPILVLPIIFTSYYLISEANPTLANKQIVYFIIGFISFGFFCDTYQKFEW